MTTSIFFNRLRSTSARVAAATGNRESTSGNIRKSSGNNSHHKTVKSTTTATTKARRRTTSGNHSQVDRKHKTIHITPSSGSLSILKGPRVTLGPDVYEKNADGTVVRKPGKRVITFPSAISDNRLHVADEESDLDLDHDSDENMCCHQQEEHTTPLSETSIRSRAELGIIDPPIIKLNHVKHTWDADGKLTHEHFDATGNFSGPAEVVDCEGEFCMCCERCDCPLPQYVETKLRCDGGFEQRRVHGDMDDEAVIGREQKGLGKHGFVLDACGMWDCKVCQGMGWGMDFMI